MFTVTLPGHTETPERGWDIPWLRIIHAANDIESGVFGEPLANISGVEVYEHATVTHHDDGTVTVAAITRHGDKILAAAAAAAAEG